MLSSPSMIPTLTSLSPTAGHSGGKTLVELVGTGFRLPTIPAPVNGIVAEPKPSVRVTFGTRAATAVAVLSSTVLYATTPIHDPSPDGSAVDVVLENIDDSGVLIPGETVTKSAAWRFVRPDVTDGDSDLVRLIGAFKDELIRQITPNVSWPNHTDFDADTADTLSVTEVPKFPGLIIATTDLEENAFYSLRDPQDSANPDDPDGFVTRAPPTTIDLLFTVVGVSDSTKELINLSATVKRFFKKNPYLTMARDPDNAGAGEVAYEMDAQDAPDVKLSIEANENNLHTFAITARVRGFDLETMFGIREADGTVARGPGGADEATLEVGKTLENATSLSIEPLG